MGNACSWGGGSSAPTAATCKALTGLHSALSTKFEPDSDDKALAHLQAIWRALLAPAPFERVSAQWKKAGFQGADPSTDVRGGGLLAVRCLAHFATLHTMGFKAMLLDIAQLEAGGGEGAFYPVSTTAIVLCSRLCDSCGLAAGMRGPIKPDQLAALLKTPPPTEFAAALWPVLLDRQRRGGFCGLFSLLLADFHVRFILTKASYLEAQTLVDAVFATLARRLAAVESSIGAEEAPTSRSARTKRWGRKAEEGTAKEGAAKEGTATKGKARSLFGKKKEGAAQDDKAKADTAAAGNATSGGVPLRPLARGASRLATSITRRRSSVRAASRFEALFAMYAQPDEASDAGPSHSQDVHALLTATRLRRVTSVKILRKAIGIVALETSRKPPPPTIPEGAPLGAEEAPLPPQPGARDAGASASSAGGERESFGTVVRAAVASREQELAAPLTPMHLALPTSTALRREVQMTDVVI